MENKNAQSAVELVIVIAAMMLFMLMMISAIQANTANKVRENRDLAVEDVANTVQSEISIAQSSSEGYERTFTLPQYLLNGVTYKVTLNGDLVYVSTLDNKTSIAIPVLNYTGNVLPPGNNNVIRKKNGTVCLNSACT